jgi:hypothetical protein
LLNYDLAKVSRGLKKGLSFDFSSFLVIVIFKPRLNKFLAIYVMENRILKRFGDQFKIRSKNQFEKPCEKRRQLSQK